MTQVWTIARHDLRRQWREGTLPVVTTVVAVLLAAAALGGRARVGSAERTVDQLHDRLEASHLELRRLATTSASTDAAAVGWNARNPDFVANDRGTLAIAPPAPLLGLSVGRTDLYPSQVKITAAGHDVATTAVEIAHPLSMATGPFDVMFVLVVLWPLAIVAMTFDLVATDRERGTLRLLLAQPASVAAIVIGPALARGSLLLVAAVGPTWLAGSASSTPDGFERQLLWSMAIVAYGIFWVGLAVWVASLGRSAATNAAWLSGAWLVLTLVVPGAISLAMAAWQPVPSGVAFADATRAATREALSDGSRVLGHFLEDHPSAAAVGRDGLREYALLRAARDQEVLRRLEPILADYRRALATERRVAGLAQFLSPALLTGNALEQAAGTSRERAVHFLDQAEAFRREWQAFFEPRILDRGALDAADAAAVPRFRYDEEPWTAAAGRIAVPVVVLGVTGLALIAAGIGRARRTIGERVR